MKIVVVLMFTVLITGCSTAYQKHSLSGGYSEKKVSPFEYAVNFSGNGYTGTQQVSDLALLRAAEIAKNNGYNYFILTNSSINIDSSTRINSGNYISTGYGTGFSVGTSTAINKPSGYLQLMFFVHRPWTSFQVYEVSNVEKTIKEKYKVKKFFSIGRVNIDEINEFHMKNALNNVNNKIETPELDLVIVNRNEFSGSFITVANIAILDDYFLSKKGENDFYIKLSKRLGTNTVVISTDKNKNRKMAIENNIDFLTKVVAKKVIQFGYRLPVKFGVDYEETLAKDGIYQVRSFSKNYNKDISKLRIGDRIIEIEGIDVKNSIKIQKILIKKAPNDIVSLKITRDKEELYIKIPLYNAEWEKYNLLN